MRFLSEGEMKRVSRYPVARQEVQMAETHNLRIMGAGPLMLTGSGLSNPAGGCCLCRVESHVYTEILLSFLCPKQC